MEKILKYVGSGKSEEHSITINGLQKRCGDIVNVDDGLVLNNDWELEEKEVNK